MGATGGEQSKTGRAVDPTEVAREDFSERAEKRRSRFSRHVCPKCGSMSLERHHVSVFLRAFRLVPGLKPRRYKCERCNAKVTLWRPATD